MPPEKDDRYPVSVVIPVLNAEAYLPALLLALKRQVPRPPQEIILVDSMSTDRTRELAEVEAGVRVIPIQNFSHGRARNVGVQAASSPIIVLMTQDAVPRDTFWMARLIEPLGHDNVVATFSRQVPRSDARPMEQFYLQTSFPVDGPVRREQGSKQAPSLSDMFFSNVSAAFVRETLLRHPFDETLIMGEDQQFARTVLSAGYATLYQPDSVVIHSHRYPLRSVFRRYVDSVYAIRTIKTDHTVADTASTGVTYLMAEAWFILRRHPLTIPYYALHLCAKVAGVLAGHILERLPTCVTRHLSLHSYHWQSDR
ncbi:MAG: glycosyltransferase [Lentisphaerae bacterium]|nr:glycosyltransferase [Lentisphaerota bacterium]